jgi:hypothetical protein
LSLEGEATWDIPLTFILKAIPIIASMRPWSPPRPNKWLPDYFRLDCFREGARKDCSDMFIESRELAGAFKGNYRIYASALTILALNQEVDVALVSRFAYATIKYGILVRM